MRHVASFRYAYRKRRPPHQRLRLLLVSWPPGHNGDGFDRESERRRRRARHLPRRGSLRLSLRHKSRSSRRRRLQGPVRRAHPRRWRRAPARSDLRGPARHRSGRSERCRGRTHHFREYGTRGESGSGLPGVRRPSRPICSRPMAPVSVHSEKLCGPKTGLPRRRSRIARTSSAARMSPPSSSRSPAA